jgi:hypothetical protein
MFVICAHAQTQRYEGSDVILDAPANGGRRANRFSGYSAIRVSLPVASITSACNGSTVSANGPNESVVYTNTTNQRWCFETASTNFTLAWQDAFGITYTGLKWLPESKWNGFVSVREFGAVGDGTTDDTAAVRNALIYIGAKTGGTLFFPTGRYKVTQTLTLPSGIVLQGSHGRTSTSFFLGAAGVNNETVILYAGSPSTNPAIFRIGEGQESIRIKNIELLGNSESGTYGIEAVGRETSLALGTSQLVSFDNTVFTNFDIGLYVHNGTPASNETQCQNGACDEWHFDYVKVESCQFNYNKTAGIHIDTFNTDWTITSTNFALPTKTSSVAADAIYIQRAGALNLQETFGGGDNPSTNRGGDFLDVKFIGGLTIVNSGSEAVTRGLVFGDGTSTGSRSSLITVINSAFETVYLANTVNYISTGNLYGAQNFTTTTDNIKIYSTGDRFCYDSTQATNPCGVTLPLPAGQRIGFQGPARVMFQTGQVKDGSIPAIPASFSGETNDEGDTVLKITVPHVSGKEKTLLELGHESFDSNGNYSLDSNNNPIKFVYKLARDKNNGYLKFTGSQDAPWRGYSFDAPIKLPVHTLTQIATVGSVSGEGTLIYCSNCIPNTSPCQAGGSGALAVSTPTQWNCK